MVVLFGTDLKNSKEIAVTKSIESSFKVIKQHIKSQNKKYLYLTTTINYDYLTIDYCDNKKFYFIKELSEDWKEQFDSYCEGNK